MASVEPRYCYRHPDRETGLSCSECGRPICYECMTPAAVGIRCPEHSGQAHGIQRVRRTAQRASVEGTDAVVTKTLIAIIVAVYLITVVQGFGINSPGGSFFMKTVLYGPFVANGDWWRLITSAFLHGGLLHIAFNMLALWWIGAPVEHYLGRSRYLLLYFASALAGSAGALLQTPTTPVVGASGAIFGILGAMVIIEWQHTGSFAGNAMTLIVINLGIGFFYSNLSWGGHIGGLVGGVLSMLALSRFGRGHAVYGKPGLVGIAGVIGVGVLSVAVAYLAV